MAQKLGNLSNNIFQNCTNDVSTYQTKFNEIMTKSINFLEKIADPNLDMWPLKLYLTCGIICFVCSSVMHLLWVKSTEVCRLTHNVDLSGISVMVYGSTVALVHYAFKCYPSIYYSYIAISTISLLALLMSINVARVRRFFINFQVTLYVTQACLAYVGLLHWRWLK